MPGYVLHQGARVICMHSGQAQPTAPFPRVKVKGQPVVTQPNPYTVTACTLPSNAGGPCVTAQWTTAATRVRAGGAAVLLQDSQAVCTPTGSGLNVVQTQTQVRGK